ncbi:MAG TPA: alkaline phosphatase family protein [Candidatus Dormibacteraeota bacterium]|nr:alkaline phosphatase family protein [Candidatus Dormibacteraeota bacterium]
MSRPRMLAATLVALLAVTATPAITSAGPPGGPLGHFKHLVVIYEENHSFDNLYGNWGTVGGEAVVGRSDATPADSVQVAQDGTPYDCLLMSDVNLMSPPLSPDCSSAVFSFGTGKPSTAYHFGNAPYPIDTYIPASAMTCPPLTNLFGFTFGLASGNGSPGGCTRDLVHRFYQEQYQLDGGRMDRYVTGSDSAGMTMGYYDTTKLPIYEYLHEHGAPHYVLADHFFAAAFGGSFLNHQYLIAAAAPLFPTGLHSVLDAAGFPNKTYPLYHAPATVVDGQVTQACGVQTTVAGLACGDYAVNTVQPFRQPAGSGARLPLIDDTTRAMNIGDEMTDAGVSWAWYAGGWDNAAGITTGPGWTNGSGPACGDPASVAAIPDGTGVGGYPYCPNRSFQFHHQPFDYFARYAPGQPGRAHLQDEQDFLASVAAGTLPQVSFVKPLGVENEHPGYASEPNGSDHLVDLIQAVESGPEAGNTLILVTYDEFGGQWDHVSPPGLGTAAAPGQADLFGPGTRIPALLIARSLTDSTVDHTVYDTTSILRTIEAQYGLAPLATRDAAVRDLGTAISAGRRGH